MEKRKSHNWTYLFFRMSTLIFAFVAVLYAMRYVSSRQFTEGVGAIFGITSVKPILLTQQSTWCGENTVMIQNLENKKQLTDMKTLGELCQFEIQSADKNILEQGLFALRISATTKNGESKLIEFDNQHSLFRQEGLVFKSEDLAKKISRAFSL